MPPSDSITREAWSKKALLGLPFWIQRTRTDKECDSAYSSYTPLRTLWTREMVTAFQCTGFLQSGILVTCAFFFFLCNTVMAQWTCSALWA